MPARALTEDERAERRERDRELVRESVDRLRSGDGWRQWLQTRARFRRYSWKNQLLIAMQHPTAERVAGFRAWLSLGYCVRKGEHAIRIWAPCPPSKRALAQWEQAGADPEAKPRLGWRPTAVFAQDQIAPLPAPAVAAVLEAPIAPISGDSHQHLNRPLDKLAGELGYTVEVAATRGDGYCDPKARPIVIGEHLSANGQVAVRIHELAHALVDADHDQQLALSYAENELVAESVAFTCCRSVGLQTDANSIPYLASWAEQAELDVLERVAQLTDRLAARIEHTLQDEPDDAEQPADAAEEDWR